MVDQPRGVFHPSTPADEQLVIFDIRASAVATNRGFLVQYLETVREWIVASASGRLVHCEVLDDIHSSDREGRYVHVIQVKSYWSRLIGVSSEAFRHTVFLFYLIACKRDLADCRFTLALDGAIQATDILLQEWSLGSPSSAILNEAADKTRTIIQTELTERYRTALRSHSKNRDAVEREWRIVRSSFEKFDFHGFVDRIGFDVARLSVEDRVRDVMALVEKKLEAKVPARLLLSRLTLEVQCAASSDDTDARVLSPERLRAVLQEDETSIAGNPQVVSLLREYIEPAIQELQREVKHLSRRVDAIHEYVREVTPSQLEVVLLNLMQRLDGDDTVRDEPIALPMKTDHKIQLNRLSPVVRGTLLHCTADFSVLEGYFQSGLVTRGVVTAAERQVRHFYALRRGRGEEPDDIFWGLVADARGDISRLESAAQVLICYLFTTCGVFERVAADKV